ncbi:hypothetical protein SERLA73DRAFT_109381 [Serpula lacrymans var. lacrymans S7.3]|uniref:Uncharacterized protein n=2 Tax=Serpula lacrymans var. lacrymans TaxID=341189 RepID=F8Q168_SERL3|nr:uncharacterized protein SERLADRAFT_438947 [Serpula lacrymans var. lacrymans S7.9]EGN98046.1 hypothetical protein SERLA73DRAFT_109381 [Serpula lacrymans var. lacrymans S7.3]EGO23636.1 hypothetical protein SERLADRAFT_438947 [Serpula lacrymans var. lacrymans S7.9]
MVADRGYTILLTHLHRPSNTLPLSTIQASITHFLANPQPLPTPLSAAVVSSPSFQPLSHSKLQALNTSFRHAVHIKSCALKSDQPGIFAQSIGAQLKSWASAVVKGLQGGQAIIKLACCSGLLLGLDDITSTLPTNQRNIRGRVEDELVLTVAEVIDIFSFRQSFDAWGKAFEPATEDGEVDALSLALITGSQSLLLVASDKVAALPLASLLRLVAYTISSAFQSGIFLSSLHSSVLCNEESRVHIPTAAPIRTAVYSISSSPLISSMGSLSKLCARTLSILIDNRPKQHMNEILSTFELLESIAAKLDADWSSSILSEGLDHDSIAPDSREITTSLWNILKTLLFATIMITESALSTIVFLPPTLFQGSSRVSPKAVVLAPQLPSTCALTTLHTLSHLSFVISQFGGVTSTATGGFVELKKAFYTALDVLSADSAESERFVRELCDSLKSNGINSIHPVQKVKQAFALASIEQLVPVLDPVIVEDVILPLCLPLLSDSTHRETYESAHSVVLAILASHTQKGGQGNIPSSTGRPEARIREDSQHVANSGLHANGRFAVCIIPFYAACLIENSVEGTLSDTQLCLAYAALVRSASTSADDTRDEQYALAWFCVDALLTAIRWLSYPTSANANADRLHRLHLTLISCVPSLPLPLLPRVLEATRAIVDSASTADHTQRQELVDALFAEITEHVGDRERELTMRWWIENRKRWEVRGQGGAQLRGASRGGESMFGKWWAERLGRSLGAGQGVVADGVVDQGEAEPTASARL